jgi:GntR family transcriptional regulator, transcriptional repressor for pyruvate dehydrogenase complex
MASQNGFTCLYRERPLSAQAAEQIARMILEQQLQVGSKLPSERRLAADLGVSRTVVREAIRLLEARSLVEVHSGSGVFVRGISPAPVTESIDRLLSSTITDVSFQDVQAVRSVLEVATAGLAAEHATERDLARIEDGLERMLHANTVKAQVEADYDFHLAIARATHNQVFVLLLQALNDVLIKTWHRFWEAHDAQTSADFVASDQQESDFYHCQIFEAIRARNLHEAERAMSRLLLHWSQMYYDAPVEG